MTEMRRSAGGAAATLAPHLDDIKPKVGKTAGDEQVTLTGTGLGNVRRVLFGEEEATAVQVVSPTEVRCKTPPNAHGPCQVVAIDSTNHRSNEITFTYR